MGLALGLGKELQFRRRVLPRISAPLLSVSNLTITIERAGSSIKPILSLEDLVDKTQVTINV